MERRKPIFRVMLQCLQDMASIHLHAQFDTRDSGLLVGCAQSEVLEQVDRALGGMKSDGADGDRKQDEHADHGGDHVLDT